MKQKMQSNDESNFFSRCFNPRVALCAPDVVPPVAHARPLDNLHQARRLLPSSHPLSMAFSIQKPKQSKNVSTLWNDRMKSGIDLMFCLVSIFGNMLLQR